MEENCLFCLESIRGNPTVNPPGCSCKIQAHESCLHAWFTQKQQLECPICHTVATPNPIVILIENRQLIEEENLFQRNQKLVAACCCVLMFWAISLTLLDRVFRE